MVAAREPPPDRHRDLPIPIVGAALSARWRVGASPDGGPGDMFLRGTALTPRFFLPAALLFASSSARAPGRRGRVGAAVVSAVATAFLAGSTANLPNDFKAAGAAARHDAHRARLAAIAAILADALLANRHTRSPCQGPGSARGWPGRSVPVLGAAAHPDRAVGHDGRDEAEDVVVGVEQVADTADALHVLGREGLGATELDAAGHQAVDVVDAHHDVAAHTGAPISGFGPGAR